MGDSFGKQLGHELQLFSERVTFWASLKEAAGETALSLGNLRFAASQPIPEHDCARRHDKDD